MWAVLTAFNTYPDWSVFLERILGEPRVGAKWEVHLRLPERAKPMVIRPVLQEWHPPHRFAWRGKLLAPWIFSGCHVFQLTALGNGGTRFDHYEDFSGGLVGPVLRKIEASTQAGFTAFNEALAQRVAEIAPE